MTKAPAPPATNKEVIAFFGGNYRDCGVCTGWSPEWDGHDVDPPCGETLRVRVWARIKAADKEISALRARIAELEGKSKTAVIIKRRRA